MKAPQSYEDADGLLKRKGEIRIALDRIDGRMNERIQQAKDWAGDAGQSLQAEDAQLSAALETFFIAERPKLGKRRSLTLNFGRLGVRGRSAIELVRGWTEGRVIGALKAAGLVQFLRVKTAINREAVHDASPAEVIDLQACGLKLERGDTFFCEPDLEALADYVAQTAKAS